MFTPYEHGPGGLYIANVDLSNDVIITNNYNTALLPYSHSFVSVLNRLEKCSEEDIRQANDAKALYDKLTLSPTAFQRATQKGEIENTEVTTKAVSKKNYIYGKDPVNVKARSTRQKPHRIPHRELITIPKEIILKI